MQTHEDSDFRAGEKPFINRLFERARDATDRKASLITYKDGEEVLGAWEFDKVHVKHLPPDEQGILRISIGGGVPGIDCDYCVFRGDQAQAAALLRRAYQALTNKPIDA